MIIKPTFKVLFSLIAAYLLLFNCVDQLQVRAASLGNIQADSILFLGNSITLHGPYIEWFPDAHWGMAASEESKDYVHLLTSQINAASGGSMQVAHDDPLPDRWYPTYPLPDYVGNVLNIADIFERNFDSWENGRIQNQLDAQPDIVVLQFGENLEGGSDQQLAAALDAMLTGLKNASDPYIFITSSILYVQSNVDAIKQQACAADPSRRVFVNLNGKVDNSGAAGHPSDAGMQTIADTIYDALVVQSQGGPLPSWTLNIDINGRSGTSQTNITKSGAAAIGAAGDVWNGYSIDAAAVSPPIIDPAQSGFLLDSAGNATTVKFDLTAVGADAPLATADDMANDLAFVEGANAGTGFPQAATFTLSGLQAGDVYDMYLYVANAAPDYSSKFTIDGLTGVTQLDSVFSGTWRHGMDYVRFPRVTVAADGTITGVLESGNPVNYGVFSGLQMTTAAPADVVTGVPISIDINGKGNASQTNVTKSGAAAIGQAGDVWNGYAADASSSSQNIVDPAQSGFLFDANGNATTIKLDITTVGADAPLVSSDDMANDLVFVEGAYAGTGFPQAATLTLSGLEAGGAYDLYLYAAAASPLYSSKFTIGDTTLMTPGGSVFTGIWVEDDNFVKFSGVLAELDGTIECFFESGNPYNYGVLSGLQIVSSSAVFMPGDANRDGKVDSTDASILAENWLGTGKGWGQGDFNADGKVNDLDATLLATNWHYGVAGVAASNSVPEPSLWAMLAAVGITVLFSRRKKG